MANLKDTIDLIQNGELLNAETLNKPVESLADQVDIKFGELELAIQGGFTPAERAKLAGIDTGATKNATDAALRDRTTHTGEQAISTITGLQAAIDDKVVKVTGKGLSTNDYTTAEKTKLTGIAAGATANRADSLNADKSHVHAMTDVTGLTGALDNKVDTVAGKGLSTNDFTTILKDKLDSIAAGAEVNVNADWASSTGDSQILNKPTLGTVASLNTGIAGGQIRTNTQAETFFVAKVAGKDLSDQNFTAAAKAKLDHITATKAVNLDNLADAVGGLSSAVVLKGSWSAATGAFPTGAKTGFSYIVSAAGIVGGINFQVNDRLLALKDGAGAVYADNWLKLDYTDQVLSVAGRQGNIVLTTDDVGGLGTLAKLNTGAGAGDVRLNSAADAKFVAKEAGKGLITDAQSTKLDGIAAGAQVNVQADWTGSGAASVKNKPIMVTSAEAVAGVAATERTWSAAKVHEAARAVSAKIEVTSAPGTITKVEGGKIVLKTANSNMDAGLPLGWNVIIAADGADIDITLAGSEVVMESGEGTFTIPNGCAVSATKVKTNTWLVHILRLKLRVGQ